MHEYSSIPNIWKRDTEPNQWHDNWDWTNPILEHLAHTPWIATEKLDGTGMRVGLDHFGTFYVMGRTKKSQIPGALMQHCLALENEVRRAFPNGHDICLYGEGVGKGIQKNGHLYGEQQRFIIFDILIDGWWLRRDSLQDIQLTTGIPVAPVIENTVSLYDAVAMWRKEPQLSLIHGQPCEGWVLRPFDNLLLRDGTPVRVKLKERDIRR